jgi:hypothetical protein
MSFKSKLMELINGLPDDDDTTDGGIREDDAPTGDADQIDDGATDGGGADEGIDEDIDESGDGDDSGDDSGVDEGDEEGLPESDVSVDQLRASLVKLGIENERLRTRLAELGGDAALTTDLDADDDLDADEDEVVEDEVDEETAQADIDAQKAQIAKLKGDG